MHLKQELRKLRERRDNASGGKQYWADGCRALGLVQDGNVLRMEQRRPAPQPEQQPPEEQTESAASLPEEESSQTTTTSAV